MSMKRISFKNIQFLRILRVFLMLAGVLFLGCLAISTTTLPFWGIHWLGTSLSELHGKPDGIVFLGGSGMPSESNLIRCWYTASAAKAFPTIEVAIVMPGELNDSTGTPRKIEEELVLRGIDKARIHFVTKGTNTRSQALECAGAFGIRSHILLVTSPEHMRRSILCFGKAGFQKVSALPAFENAAEADFSFADDDLGSSSPVVPDVGHNLNLRYQIWTHLKYEILIFRELLAISYYWIRGWI